MLVACSIKTVDALALNFFKLDKRKYPYYWSFFSIQWLLLNSQHGTKSATPIMQLQFMPLQRMRDFQDSKKLVHASAQYDGKDTHNLYLTSVRYDLCTAP